MSETNPRATGGILRRLHRGRAQPWGKDPRDYEPEAVRSTLAGVGRLFGEGCYFELDLVGWEHVPAPPVMVVSNHSGGTSIPDVWGVLVAWYRTHGVHRPIHALAHEILLSNRISGAYLGRRGILHADGALALEALTTLRRDVLVMPGGDIDTWRPYSRRYEVCFAGRTGYARLALKAGVPIVPVANAGAHETLIVLTDGRRLARALRLHALVRADIFPVHISFPWGLALGPWPHIPPPSRLRYRVGPVVPPPGEVRSGEEPDGELVRAYDVRVQAAVQRLLDELRDSR
jgi:1-acyl-sn-glycerol-3-phosphate acyltransferase